MGNQEKEAKAAPQSQQEQQERDRKRRFDECNKEIEALKIEIKNILDDIAIARKKEEPTGALFTESSDWRTSWKLLKKNASRKWWEPTRNLGPISKRISFDYCSSSVKRKAAAQLSGKYFTERSTIITNNYFMDLINNLVLRTEQASALQQNFFLPHRRLLASTTLLNLAGSAIRN